MPGRVFWGQVAERKGWQSRWVPLRDLPLSSRGFSSYSPCSSSSLPPRHPPSPTPCRYYSLSPFLSFLYFIVVAAPAISISLNAPPPPSPLKPRCLNHLSRCQSRLSHEPPLADTSVSGSVQQHQRCRGRVTPVTVVLQWLFSKAK